MEIKITKDLDIKSDVLVLGLFDENSTFYKTINPDLDEEIKKVTDKNIFETDFAKTYATKISNSAYDRILIIRLGKKSELDMEKIRRVMARIVAFMKSSKLASFTTNIAQMIIDTKINGITIKDVGCAFAEGLLLAEYQFNKYLSKKNANKFIASIVSSDSLFKEGFDIGRIIAESTNYAKDIVNEPAIVVTPQYLVDEVTRLFKNDKKFTIKVMEKKEMQQKGLNALLGVSRGSDLDPKLIFIEYNGLSSNAKKDPFTAIVGKGITFDSGGYDIKPAGQFADMKCDMSGAAAVIGTLIACSKLGVKKNILGVIPTCENLINGSALKPGDIIRAYNGKTIEIGNTDAEGRLILADAICYTEKNYSTDTIIDLATLTGACVVALGFYYAGLFYNDDGLGKNLVAAGNKSNDRVWPMPFDKDYHDLMDGDIADLKNISKWTGYKAAGSITGAVFINKFVDKAKWAHIDIAGTAFLAEAKEYNQKYASGSGVRLLTYYFMQ